METTDVSTADDIITSLDLWNQNNIQTLYSDLGGEKAQENFEQAHISESSLNASLSQIDLSAVDPGFGKPSTHAADLNEGVSLNADIEPRKKDRLGLSSFKATPEPTLIRATAFGSAL
jgi:hypothetical protein